MIVTKINDNKVEVNSTVKINMMLKVLGKRPDSYHELETIMLEVPWGDTLVVEKMSENSV